MDFSSFLTSLMHGDNTVRRSAEEHYNQQLHVHTDATINALMDIFSSQNESLVIRSFAGVLLRRAVELYSKKVGAAFNQAVRLRFLSLWIVETNPAVLQRLSHVMAQSAVQSPWLELLPSIIGPSLNDRSLVSKPVFGLIEALSEYCPEDIAAHLPLLGPFLSRFVGSDCEHCIQVACSRAICACVASFEDTSMTAAFRPALEPVIRVLITALSTHDEIDATKIMNYLVDIAQSQPGFFKGSLDCVAQAMLTAADAHGLEFSTRSMALELMVTITETAPALVRRCSSLSQGLIPLAMSLMLEVEEDEDQWQRGAYCEQPDDRCWVGDEALERVAAGLGGRSVSDPLLAAVQRFAAMQDDYRYRRAAVAGLCRLAEGCTKHFGKLYYERSVDFIVISAGDRSPRVKYEAIQTIGRFACLFPEYNDKLVAKCLPLLSTLLGDQTECDRVRGHSASALINLLDPESCAREGVVPHLDQLMKTLVLCLQTALSVEVRSACLTVVGCLAQVCGGELFAPYYGSFMPGIKSILQQALGPDLVLFRGKAMECVGLIGEAVGVNIFASDATDIMRLFIQALQLDTERNTTFDYILPACARISRAMRMNFEPYLQMMVEPLLQAAQQDIQFSIVDAGEDDVEGDLELDEETGTESSVISIGALGKKRVTMNTHAVQQKNQAVRILYEFAASLKGYLKSFILPSLQVLVDLVANKHASDIRCSACLAMSSMFDAMLHAMKLGYLSDDPSRNISLEAVLVSCVSRLLDGLRDETDATARLCAAEALRDVVKSCYCSGSEHEDCSRSGFALLPPLSLSERVVREVLTRCGDSLERRKARESSILSNEGYDAEDREAGASQMMEEEDELLTTYADIFGQLLKLHGEQFLPEFDHFIAPAFSKYLDPHQPESLQKVAIFLVDDLIEFGGTGAQKYIPNLMPIFMTNALSPSVSLVQSSVYGIAKAVYSAPQVIISHVGLGVVLNCLVTVTDLSAASDQTDDQEDDDDCEDDYEGTVENAVFAIGTICSEPAYRSALQTMDAASVDQLCRVWLQRMPLKLDEVSSKLSSKQLCDSFEHNDPVVLGADCCHLAEIFRAVGQIFQNSSSSAVTSRCGEAPLLNSNSPSSVAFKDDELFHHREFSDETDDCPISMAHPHTLRRLQSILQRSLTAPSTIGVQAQKAFLALPAELQQAIRDRCHVAQPL